MQEPFGIMSKCHRISGKGMMLAVLFEPDVATFCDFSIRVRGLQKKSPFMLHNIQTTYGVESVMRS